MSRILYNISDIIKGGVAMNNGYMQEIRDRILAAEEGSVFVAPDFADIADTATIRQGLKRLYQSGIIRRIIRYSPESAGSLYTGNGCLVLHQ